MSKTATMALVALLLTPISATGVAACVTERPNATVADSMRSDIAQLYDSLRSSPKTERLHRYEQLPSSLKSAVWAHQLSTALAEHPEFSAEQRAVIQQMLLLLTPDFFEIDSSNPQWTDRVDNPLRALTRRAIAAFGAKAARELFAQLGPDEPPGIAPAPVAAGVSSNRTPGIPRHVVADDLPDCTCSTISDYCGLMYRCVTGGCYWRSWGCGTLLQYACTGLCVMYEGGGGG